MRGLLITFSGIDGAGKSTQIRLLTGYFRRFGHKPVYIWARGGYTPLFQRFKCFVRKLPFRAIPPAGQNQERARAFRKAVVRRLWLFLALLDMLLLYAVRVRWLLYRGCTVICDRYLWDTLLDFRVNFPQEQVEHWWTWRLLRRIAPRPDLAFLLLVPVEESLRRSDLKGEPFRDSPEVLGRKVADYQAMADELEWHVIDCRKSIGEVAGEILHIIEKDVVKRISSLNT